MDELQFINNTVSYDSNEAFAVQLSSVNGKFELLNQTGVKLKFPDYFGFNWDALDECLRDFDRIEQQDIILIHNELPVLSDADMKIYLEILIDAVKKWKVGEKHSLKIFFMEKDKSKLDQYL